MCSVVSREMLCSSLNLTYIVKTEHGEEGTARKNPPSMNPQSPGSITYHLYEEPNFSNLSSWGHQHSVCLLWLRGSECKFLRSDQSSLCGGAWFSWESINSKGILAVDYGYPSSPHGCLPTGLHFELQQCCSGKKLNHNHILI